MDWVTRLSERQKDRLCISAIIGILLVRFFQPIFLGKSISKFFLVAHWDSLLYSLKNGQGLGMDPSLVQLFIPYRFLVAEYWHHGLPLWNQWSGFGMPLLADPQSLVFSPLFVFFCLHPSMHIWDLILIVQLAVAVISTYFLCKELELNFAAGLVSSLLFIFNPWLLWQIELLGTGTCLVPFVFLFFCKMAKKGSFGNIALAGIAAAIDVLSAHPEISFTTIFFACIFTCLTTYYNDRQHHSLLSILHSTMSRIFLAGLIAFGLSAPVFIPFLEYAHNAESYKLETIASAGLSWQAIFANYLFPFQPKASLFFGALSLWGVLALLYFANNLKRFAHPIIICLLISIVGVVRPYPFELLFKIPPFSMTYATYWMPEYFLFVCIASGLGCSYLIDKCFNDKFSLTSKQTQVFVLSGLILLTMPLLYFLWHNNTEAIQFDKTFEPSQFNWKIWIFNTSSTLIALFVLLSATNKSKKWKSFASTIFLILGFSSLALASSKSLIIRPSFQYPKTLRLSEFNGCADRFMSIGNHLLKPNTNLIYRLPLLQVLNPIFPKGFIAFTKACGAETDQYTQIFSPIISPLLKIAGVNKILSEQPILDRSLLNNLPIYNYKQKQALSQTQINYTDLVSLRGIKLLLDNRTNALYFYSKALSSLSNAETSHLLLSIEDSKGNSVCYIEPQAIVSNPKEQEILASGLIPKDLKHWAVSLRIMRDKDCSIVAPEHLPFGRLRSNNSWLISNSGESGRFIRIDNDRFKLTKQEGSLLEYEDTKAFNRHFFVNKVVWVKNKEGVLSFLTAHPNELQNVAVLESKEQTSFYKSLQSVVPDQSTNTLSKLTGKAPSIVFDQSASVFRTENADLSSVFQSSTDFSLKVSANNPALLISSNIYYPGWKVFIDNKESKIFCADYLFRAVIIPSGQHIIRFIYQPLSFTLGILFFVLTAIILLILTIRQTVIRQT